MGGQYGFFGFLGGGVSLGKCILGGWGGGVSLDFFPRGGGGCGKGPKKMS